MIQIFGSDVRNNCKSAKDYVFHLTCVMPIPGKTFQTCYVLVINKQSNSKTPNLKIISINLTQ